MDDNYPQVSLDAILALMPEYAVDEFERAKLQAGFNIVMGDHAAALTVIQGLHDEISELRDELADYENRTQIAKQAVAA